MGASSHLQARAPHRGVRRRRNPEIAGKGTGERGAAATGAEGRARRSRKGAPWRSVRAQSRAAGPGPPASGFIAVTGAGSGPSRTRRVAHWAPADGAELRGGRGPCAPWKEAAGVPRRLALPPGFRPALETRLRGPLSSRRRTLDDEVPALGRDFGGQPTPAETSAYSRVRFYSARCARPGRLRILS